MNLSDVLYSEILPKVEKPSRYLGTELNTSHKDPASVDLRVSLIFPDLYDLGLGNVGILILYSILNDLDWVWCERAYAPGLDMEAALRERGLPLFCNESKDPLGDMDLIGITLQSELTYTNILNIIDLAGFPVRSKDRADDAPLFFAGGPAVFNPEPLAPFIDFFAIGDGEDIIVEIAECVRPLKGRPRREKLEALSKIEGIYVPELYPFETLPTGQIVPKEDAPKVVKRIVDLESAKFPTNYIVPYTQQVHDRLALEVLRGCTQGCRFCQAGMVTRAVRERSLETIDNLMQEALAKTGYEEVALVSLSTCDFSRPKQLAAQASARASSERISVSLPSLRLDSFSVEMADAVADVRRSGLTFAPEAASPRLRALINKWIPDEGLLDMAGEAYKRGWDHVKCYFMIGLPTERDEDIEAIADLCERTLKVGKDIKQKASVRLGVSTFVPKPFTPFQWAEQIGLEETERRQRILDARFKRNPSIRFGRHEAATTFIEGLVTRADRRGGDLIEAAWKRGARFESWDELCILDAWLKAIEDVDYDVEGEFRERALDERLPWDHIDVMIPKEWFQEDWQRAMELQHALDCRAGKCHMCGVIFREREVCQHMLKNQRRGRIEEREFVSPPKVEYVEPEAVMRVRLRIGRDGEARFLSHLEFMNAWQRAMRRARVPMSYTQGFHAHPRMNFATPAPVGEESVGDYMDIVLSRREEPRELLGRIRAVLPAGMYCLDAEEVPMKAPSLMSQVSGLRYTFYVDGADTDALGGRIADVLAAERVGVQRKQKAKKSKKGRGRRGGAPRAAEVNLRPMIEALVVRDADGPQTEIDFTTVAHEGKLAKPREMLALLGIPPERARVVKRETMLAAGEMATA